MSADTLSPAELAALRAQMRPWDRAGYGTDGRLTGLVDFYDGFDQGCRTTEPAVPRRCLDKKSWLAGWDSAQEPPR